MPRKLTPADLERYKALLLHLRMELSGDISDLENDAFVTDGERAPVDSPADVGSDSFAQEFSLELLARDEATLNDVVEALDRIRAGTYGLCEECGEAIPRPRLSAVPHARNCIDCQRRLEEAS